MSRMTDILGPEGLVARALGDRFEHRDEQIRVADAIADALHARAHLLVEAGTGTGKSFAYLAPAMRRCLDHAETVVAVTNTISLQEQLVAKDIPLLAALLNPADGSADDPADDNAPDPANARASRGVPPRSDQQPSHQPLHPSDPAFDPNDLIDPTDDADGIRLDDHNIPDTPDKPTPAIIPCLVKGRGNYLSIRRLELASRRQDKLFPDRASVDTLHDIEAWAYETTDGTLATLPQLERPAVWDRVQSDAGNCMGRRCHNYDRCFYQAARRRMERADLLICNHALFFSDLALRANDVGFLPKYDHVILDEAHHVEDIAGEHFGLSITEASTFHLLGLLHNTRRQSGFLATLDVVDDAVPLVDRTIHLVMEASELAKDFFAALTDHVRQSRAAGSALGGPASAEEATTATVTAPGVAPLNMAAHLHRVGVALKELRGCCRHEEDRYELASYADRALTIAQTAESLVNLELPGCAYWVESSRSGRVAFACAPVEVAPILEKELFGREHSVILTSATLTISRDPDTAFDHCRSRLGCPHAAARLLGSPFDHAAQVELHIERDMPDPREASYTQALVERIGSHIRETDGGAFVLFTSFRLMHKVADLLHDQLAAMHMPVWVHGRDGSRSHILEGFRQDERSVLFGTSSFWQGVDVRGRGLRNVIITRLPFDPPDRPIVQARTEFIRERGGNPFMEDALPRAIIRFKQGFGRLIRSATDSGRVVVLDPRIVTRFYGRRFLAALPESIRIIDGPRDRG
ncbi:MAG: DEAD/DEAH box helicase family protein [Phycisphaerales bacterium]|nr:DEAD/DEAH box helicase family protein [Phycisphaerales bacterium]